jgi:hypothetical protein
VELVERYNRVVPDFEFSAGRKAAEGERETGWPGKIDQRVQDFSLLPIIPL